VTGLDIPPFAICHMFHSRLLSQHIMMGRYRCKSAWHSRAAVAVADRYDLEGWVVVNQRGRVRRGWMGYLRK
jgi:hypothetical protein